MTCGSDYIILCHLSFPDRIVVIAWLCALMAFVAFGQHPDENDDVKKTLKHMLGASLDSEGESVATRIAKYHAPPHIKTIIELIEWYLNISLFSLLLFFAN